MTEAIEATGEYLTIKLEALTEIDISKLVDRGLYFDEPEKRFIAFFEIENSSNKPWAWEETDFQFVTEEGYMIETDLINIPSQNLPTGWHCAEADIPPSAKINALVSLGQLDDGEHIQRIVYETKLAEAWYSALSRDEIVEYSKEFERIELSIPESGLDSLDELPD